MPSAELDQLLKTWAGLASHFIGECFDCAKPLIDKDYNEIDPYVRFVNAQLYIDCHLTSESALILIREGREWDADLLARSIMEGSLKYVYILLGDQSEISKKVCEYWELLPVFSSVKHSERASHFLSAVPDPENKAWNPLKELILDDDEATRLREEWPRVKRKSIEETWSFSGLLRQFAQSDNKKLRLFAHLAHGYGMSSHLLHKDADGVKMVWERARRSPERQTVVKLAHAARVVSDICTFSELRLFFLLKACNRDSKVIPDIEKTYTMFFQDLKKASDHFIRIEYEAFQEKEN